MSAFTVFPVMLVLVAMGSSHTLTPVLDITLLEVKDSSCQTDLQALKQALDSGQDWAQRMVDSGVRSPVGLFSQVEVQFGDFDQCLSISTPVTSQYCLMDVWLNDTRRSSFKWAVCVPASCSPQTLTSSLQTYMDHHGSTVRVEVNPSSCTTRDSMSVGISSGGVVFCVVMALIVIAVCISTAYDTGETSGLMQCLSARRNYRTLMGPCESIPGINTQFICGFHVLNMYILVLSHRYVSPMFFMNLVNYEYVEQSFLNPISGMWTCHVDLLIDIAFFLSAFLLSLNYQLELQKRFVSPIKMIVRRVFRLVPVYLVVIIWYTTVFRMMGKGPLWNRFMDDEERMCASHWWANLLFVHNYVGNNEMCLQHTWFLSCDFQLYIVGLLLVMLVQKNLRLGLTAMGVVFVMSTLAAFLGTYLYDLPAMTQFFKNYWVDVRADDMFLSVYTQGHYRGTSYLMGLLAGCYVYRHRGTTLSKTATNTLQTLGFAICFLVYWSGILVHRPRGSYGVMFASLYAATFHSLFGLGEALIFVSLVLGTSTPVSRMLSWRGFQPLSKLCYGLYLVHYPLLYLWHGTSRAAYHGTFLTAVNLTMSDLVVSQAISFLLYLTVEAPARNLYRYYTRGPAPLPPKQTLDQKAYTNGTNGVYSINGTNGSLKKCL